jgi:hypothetical protein
MNEVERRYFEGVCRVLDDRALEETIAELQKTSDVDEFQTECLEIATDEADLRELDI